MSPDELARADRVLANAAEAVRQWRGIVAWLDARQAERDAAARLPRQEATDEQS